MYSNDGDNKKFEQRVRAQLRTHVDDCDADTRRRLADSRKRALDQLPAEPQRYSRWLPAGALAAALALVGVWIVVGVDDRSGKMPDAVEIVADVEDFELLWADDDLEMFEDLEFFAWLDTTGEAG